MKLILAYYLKEEQNFIRFETLDDIDIDDGFSRFIDIDNYINNTGDMIRTDLYTLRLVILEKYYGDKFKSEVVDNQEQYEAFFDEKFVYNFEVC